MQTNVPVADSSTQIISASLISNVTQTLGTANSQIMDELIRGNISY